MQLVIGLTGGIGSGKTAASDWFAAQGIAVVDADVVAREVVAPGAATLAAIRAHFGDWVIAPDGGLNRAALREHIFSNPAARVMLEQITHPAIRATIIDQLQQASSPYVILVSPLLFESQQHQLTQRVLLIDAEPELQVRRASQRDGQSSSQIEKIIAAQMPRAEKCRLADDIVVNHADLANLYEQLQPLHLRYLAQAAAHQSQA